MWLVVWMLGCGGTGEGSSGTAGGTATDIDRPPALGTAPVAWVDAGDGHLHGDLSTWGLGAWLATADLDGDGVDDVVTSDASGADLLVWSGASGVVGQGGEAFRLRTPFQASAEGASVALGDFDGDGHIDAAASQAFGATTVILFRGPLDADTPWEDTLHFAGAVHALGDLSGTGADMLAIATSSFVTLATGPDLTTWGTLPNGGATCLASGDVDGDGQLEVLVGRSSGGDAVAAGEVQLFPALPGALGFEHAVGEVRGTAVGQRLGASCALADHDGDGTDDVIVGGSGDPAGVEPGRVLVFPDLAGSVSWAQAATVWTDGGSRSSFGAGLAAADLDGDGAAEIVVGGPGYSEVGGDGGALAVLPGGVLGAWGLHDGLRVVVNPDGLEAFGAPVALADLDGDGRLDAVVGAPEASLDDLALTHEGGVFRVDLGGL